MILCPLYLYHDRTRERLGWHSRIGACLASTSPRTFTNDERAYLFARALFFAAMTAIYFLGVAQLGHDFEQRMYLGTLAIVALTSAGFYGAVFWWGVRVERAMLWVLPLDLVALAAFVYLGIEGDWFYPMCVMLPVMYALVVRKREAWLVGAATAVAYMVAHAFYPLHSEAAFAMFALKAVAIPIVGALVASAVAKSHSREREIELAMAENTAINERLSRRVAELQAVSQITDVIHSSLDFDNVGPTVLEIVSRLIGVSSCCLFIIDKVENETIFSASVGSHDYVPGQASLIARGANEPDEHFTCTSVFDRGEIMVLFCAAAQDIERLTAEDSLVVSAVASELVVAVENSRLYKLTKRLAITDELTGLFNYRYLQQRLDEETGRAARYRKYVSLLMLDVDDFKSFNDSFGHIAGDVALAELADVLRRAVREVDVVARYGGEEFSVLLPETDAAGAYSVAEKVREAVAMHLFADPDGVRCCHLTVSIGLATFLSHADDKESLLREADNALYAAKSVGKNRVRSSEKHLPQASTLRPHGDLS